MFRTTNRRLLCALSLSFLAGCGESSTTSQSTMAPSHGGQMFSLPDERGFVEIQADRGAAPRGGRGKPAAKTQIMAYFYQSDGKTEMSPAPTDVKIKIGSGEGGSVVNLSAEPKEAGKYASAPGDHPDGFAGKLEATLNGQPVEVPIRIR